MTDIQFIVNERGRALIIVYNITRDRITKTAATRCPLSNKKLFYFFF